MIREHKDNWKENNINYIYVFVLGICIGASLIIMFYNIPYETEIIEINEEEMNILCEQYASLNKVDMIIQRGEKYINIQNQWILEQDVKDSCLR